MLQQQLTTLLAQTDIALTEKQQQQLVRYVELLDKWNKAYNLLGVDPNKLSQYSGRA